jgi:hypothetical protein
MRNQLSEPHERKYEHPGKVPTKPRNAPLGARGLSGLAGSA